MEKEKSNYQREKRNLYQDRDPRNYITANEPRALYWYKYRRTYELLRSSLKIGNKIPCPLVIEENVDNEIFLSNYCFDSELNLLDLPIVLVGNNLLTPFNFDIRKRDRTPIVGVEYPGISATIGFSNNLAETCGGIFDRDCRRQDRMFCTTVSKIEECNYKVYYLPTENQPLHVRLVHKIHETNLIEHLAPFKDRELLANTFSDGKVF